MKKIDWLQLQLEKASGNQENYWPEGTEGLTKLFMSKGEAVTRDEFWTEFWRCFQATIGPGGPTGHAIEAFDYFTISADFSLAWDVEPKVSFPRIPNNTLLKIIDENHEFLQIGGDPAWIQNPSVPMCPRCKCDMAMLLQLNSLPDDVRKTYPDTAEIDFADSGRIYLFCCKNDGEFELRYQYY